MRRLSNGEEQDINITLNQMRVLFNKAWTLNNSGNGTDLSRLVERYILDIEQSYKYFAWRSMEDEEWEI